MSQTGDRLADITGQSQLGWIKLHDILDGSWGLILTFPTDMHPTWATVQYILFFLDLK